MKLVKETINFERGQNPKTSMEIGTHAKIKEWLNKAEYYDKYDIDKERDM